MPPQKRTWDGRPILPDPAELQTVIASLQTMITTFAADHPDTNDLVAIFQTFTKDLAKYCQPTTSSKPIPATTFTTIESAADAVQVTHQRNSQEHLWQLRHSEDSDELSDGRLSEWADTGVNEILKSPYFRLANSETTCRTILDMIFCDRLKQLKDSKSEQPLNWFPEMQLSVKSEPLNKLIQGRADNCLAYGKGKSELHTALVVLEAKKLGLAASALPQLIIYLAAVQDSRKELHKTNSCVFGLLTDSEEYEFVYLNEDRNLFLSDTYRWVSQKHHIIQWIDKILQDSIEATPHTTPVKTGNTTIHNYQNLDHSHQFGTFKVIDDANMRRWKVVTKLSFGDVLMELESDEESDGEVLIKAIF